MKVKIADKIRTFLANGKYTNMVDLMVSRRNGSFDTNLIWFLSNGFVRSQSIQKTQHSMAHDECKRKLKITTKL